MKKHAVLWPRLVFTNDLAAIDAKTTSHTTLCPKQANPSDAGINLKMRHAKKPINVTTTMGYGCKSTPRMTAINIPKIGNALGSTPAGGGKIAIMAPTRVIINSINPELSLMLFGTIDSRFNRTTLTFLLI
jgi:hypothetical protein